MQPLKDDRGMKKVDDGVMDLLVYRSFYTEVDCMNKKKN